MTLGNRTLGSNTLGGRRPTAQVVISVVTADIPETIRVTEHLNIKYRKISTNLWSRQSRNTSYGLLITDLSEHIITDASERLLLDQYGEFERVARQTSTYTRLSRDSSSWTRLDKNE